MPDKSTITFERLQEVLTYDPITGIFVWRIFMCGRAVVGSIAGRKEKDGYIRIAIDGKLYHAQHLAWFYMTGQWPKETIDHKDRNRSCNRWDNLREASMVQQNCNRATPRTNKSGHKGVMWSAKRGKWRVGIGHKGRTISLGYVKTIDEAIDLRRRAANKFHGEFANHD